MSQRWHQGQAGSFMGNNICLQPVKILCVSLLDEGGRVVTRSGYDNDFVREIAHGIADVCGKCLASRKSMVTLFVDVGFCFSM